MTKTEELFQDAIKISAEVVKDINEDDYDLEDNDIIDLNDKVSDIQCELLELPMDFEVKNRKEYCKKLLGKDYFSDNRCWDYLSDIVYEIENDIGSMIMKSIKERSEENKKSLKESKEFFVGSKTWQGYEVCMIEDGKKYYLSKLAKNVADSDWSSDHTYAKHWKDKSRAEEIVDELNSLNESLKERSQENEITVSELQDTVEYFCGLFEEKGELKGNALKDLKNAVERLEVFNAIGSIYQWGVEVLNKNGVKYNGLKESLKEGTDLKDILSIINNLDDDKLPSAMTFNYLSKWIKEYSKIYNLPIPKFDDYKNWNGKEWKIYFGTISNLPKPRKSMKEGKNVKKSLEIIRRKLMELINDDTIQEEFNEVWEDNGIYDSVDDMFEVSVHNVLNSLLKENTITIIPF